MTLNRYRFSKAEINPWMEKISIQLRKGNFHACGEIIQQAKRQLGRKIAPLTFEDSSCLLFECCEVNYWGDVNGYGLRTANHLSDLNVHTVEDVMKLDLEDTRIGKETKKFILYCRKQFRQGAV